jgi:hypothetical protein
MPIGTRFDRVATVTARADVKIAYCWQSWTGV